ncbi:hypothetical protein [Leifsonia aquatica]|uniref:hypothetical protein n=1 Tax=Leifsonia aquatica TaxID=144185 RepID=UPI00382702D9
MTGVAAAAPNLNCPWWDGTCNQLQIGVNINDGVTGAVADGANSAGNAVLSGIAQGLLTSWQQFELNFLTSWINMPPLVDLNDPNGTTIWLIGVLSYLTAIAALIGILINSIYLMIALRGDRARKLGLSLMWLLILNNAAPAFVATIELGIHAMASGILKEADITAGAAVTEAAVVAAMPGVYLIAAIIGTIGVFIQYGIMFTRAALLPLFVGVTPLAAAIATIGGKATGSFEKIIGWTIAFVVYPLPAAIVYVTAFRLKSGYDGVNGAIAGMILEILAIFALPALFRIIAPHTAALGKAYGGKIALDAAITVAETAAAVGAMVLTAGAVGGALGGKAASGSPKGAGNANAGASAPASSSPMPETTDGPSASPAGAAASADAGSAPASSAPSGAAPTGSADAGARPAADTASVPAGAASTPADESRSSKSASSKSERQWAYTAQQSAHHISNAAGRTARQHVDDVDEIIGGKA